MSNGDKFKCKLCDGRGIIQIGPPLDVKGCPVCDGVGYLDWIETIVGKKKKIKYINFAVKDEDLGLDTSLYEVRKEMMKELSNQMAYNIDKMILEEATKRSTKIYGQEPVKNYGRK